MAAYKQAAAAMNENNQETGVLFPPPEGPYSAYLVLPYSAYSAYS